MSSLLTKDQLEAAYNTFMNDDTCSNHLDLVESLYRMMTRAEAEVEVLRAQQQSAISEYLQSLFLSSHLCI